MKGFSSLSKLPKKTRVSSGPDLLDHNDIKIPKYVKPKETARKIKTTQDAMDEYYGKKNAKRFWGDSLEKLDNPKQKTMSD